MSKQNEQTAALALSQALVFGMSALVAPLALPCGTHSIFWLHKFQGLPLTSSSQARERSCLATPTAKLSSQFLVLLMWIWCHQAISTSGYNLLQA